MPMPSPSQRPSRGLLALLLVASFAVITLDARGGPGSPVEPVRSAVGQVFGPLEAGTAAVVRPFRAVPEFLTTTGTLRQDVARLEAENSQLRSRLASSALDRNRAAELDGLLRTSASTGYDLVPARVVAMGPAQSFSWTVTIDAGTSSGVRPDETVLNNDGLVGRVIRADRTTATVLLIVDQESVVGGRLGSSMEVGFLRGRGRMDSQPMLDLELVDNSATPGRHESVVTWGSSRGGPYVPGIPIGTVRAVYSSPRQLSKQAVIRPYVDFGSLDVVGVVVKKGVHGDRSVIKADSPSPTGASR